MRTKIVFSVLFILTFVLFNLETNAQKREIKGKVINAETAEPVANVTVTVKGTSISTITDADGNYHLLIPDSMRTIEFSDFQGMKIKEVELKSPEEINIYLTLQTLIDLFDLSLEELMNIEFQIASTKKENIFNTPSSVTIIDKEQINKYNFNTIAEALQVTAGMSMYRTYLKRNIPTARGILQDHYANKVLVMINGIPSWNAVTGEGNVERIDINDVERIEILKGPASVLYGTNAYSGAINIVLKKSDEMALGSHISIGNHGLYSAGGNFSAKYNDFFISAYGNLRDEIGPNTHFLDETGLDAIYQEYIKSANFTLNTEYKSHSILFNGFNSYESYLGVVPKFSSGAGNDHVVQGYLLNYTFNKDITDKINLIFGGSYDWGKRDLSRSLDDVVRARIVGDRICGLFRANINLNENFSVEAGGDIDQRRCFNYENYDTKQDTLIADNNMSDWEVLEYSGFGQLKFTKDKFTALAGSRYTNNELFGGNLSSRATLVYAFSEKSSVKLIYGESFRAPSIFELHFITPTQTVFGSPSLEPEKSKSVELAYLKSFKNLFFQALVYHGIYDNKIMRIKGDTLLPDGTQIIDQNIYKNGGTFTANGLELELKYTNPGVISAFANYNFVKGDKGDELIDTAGVGNDNYNFKYIPEHTISLGLSKTIKERFFISGLLNYWSGVEGPFEKISAQQTIDLNIGYTHDFKDGKIRHSLSIKNLLDEEFIIPEYVRRKVINSVPSGYFRSIYYTIKVQF